MIVAAVALLAFQAAAQTDDLTQFCRKASETRGVEYLELDGGFFKMARAFMSKEEKEVMKALRVKSMDVLTLEKCDAAKRSEIIKEARDVLARAPFVKAPEQANGSDVYFVPGADADALEAIVILIDSAEKSSICRMCGDIRRENVKNITL